jgi:hypothetical protein
MRKVYINKFLAFGVIIIFALVAGNLLLRAIKSTTKPAPKNYTEAAYEKLINGTSTNP